MGCKLEYAIISGDGKGRLEPPTGSLDPLFMPVREGDIILQVSYTVTSDTQSKTNADFVTFSTVDGVEITEVRVIKFPGIVVRSVDGDTVRANPEAATFVTEDPMGEPVVIEVDASTGGRNMDDQVIWTMVDNPDDAISSGTPIPISSPQAGPTMTYSFNPISIPAATSGRGGPLSYQIMASIVSGVEFNDKIIITQDEIDQIRQEYIDISKRTDDRRYKGPLPAGGVFTNSVRSEFNSSDYNYWIVNWQINLADKFDDLEAAYGSDIGLTSGYRNPAKQLKTRNNTGKANSFHVYGMAIDYNQGDHEENYNVAKKAYDNFTLAECYLYDQRENMYRCRDCFDLWPDLPEGATAYTHGHIAWK